MKAVVTPAANVIKKENIRVTADAKGELNLLTEIKTNLKLKKDTDAQNLLTELESLGEDKIRERYGNLFHMYQKITDENFVRNRLQICGSECLLKFNFQL